MAGKAAARLEVVHADCAGIDVGKRKHYAAVDSSRFERPVRHFAPDMQPYAMIFPAQRKAALANEMNRWYVDRVS